MQLGAVGRSWMRLDAVGCSWMQLDAVGCGWMRLDAVGCSWVGTGRTWMHLGAPTQASPGDSK